MLVGRGFESEFAEDVGDVLFNGSFTNEELFGNGGVGVPLGHGGQDFEFASRQVGQQVIAPATGDELGNDFRVERRPAGCHPGDGCQELRDVGHPVLQQITNRADAGFEQFAGVFSLDVLREDEDWRIRNQTAGFYGGPNALIAEGWRHADVDDGNIRVVVEDCLDEVGAVLHLCDNDMPGIVQKPGNTFTQKNSIFGDYNA